MEMQMWFQDDYLRRMYENERVDIKYSDWRHRFFVEQGRNRTDGKFKLVSVGYSEYPYPMGRIYSITFVKEHNL